MDPDFAADIGSMAGFPWLGRGRGLQPQEPMVGRSRGLLLATEWPAGRARGFPRPDDTPQAQGVTSDQPVFGLARGLFLRATQPKLSVGRGSVIAIPEAEPIATPPCESMMLPLTEEIPATKEVCIRAISNLKVLFLRNITAPQLELLRLLSPYRLTNLPPVKHQHWSQCFEEWALRCQWPHGEEEYLL